MSDNTKPNNIKTIFVTISRGSLIRNFFQTGVISALLDRNVRVVVLSPFKNPEKLLEEYRHNNLLFESLQFVYAYTLKDRLMREFLKGASFNRTIHTRYLYRITNVDDPPSKKWYLPRMLFFVPLGFVPGFKRFIRWVDMRTDPQKEHDALFLKYQPDLVFSTSPFEKGDISVLKGAKRYNVPTIAMPKSWDNMSKLLSNVKVDKLLVWSPFVQKQSIRYQDYEPDDVIITGAPQFDIYTNKEVFIPRDEFCKQNGLDPNKKILLYCSTGNNACYETHYVRQIAKWIEDGTLKGAQLFIRPHVGYVGDIKQFQPLERHPFVVLDTYDAKRQNTEFKDNWNIDRGHLIHLCNSFFHAVATLNVSSTVTLDSTMVGTPAINLHFDLDDVGPNMSVDRLYKCDYIDAIVDSKGSWVVESKEELLETLQNITSGKEDLSRMKLLVDYLGYKQDGNSVSRIVTAMCGMLSQ